MMSHDVRNAAAAEHRLLSLPPPPVALAGRRRGDGRRTTVGWWRCDARALAEMIRAGRAAEGGRLLDCISNRNRGLTVGNA